MVTLRPRLHRKQQREESTLSLCVREGGRTPRHCWGQLRNRSVVLRHVLYLSLIKMSAHGPDLRRTRLACSLFWLRTIFRAIPSWRSLTECHYARNTRHSFTCFTFCLHKQPALCRRDPDL